MTKYIIIGGDAAGMSAAMQIRRTDNHAEIWAFEMGETFSYAQCGLPYYIEGIIPSSSDLIARSEEIFNEKYKINARSSHEVTAIDPDKKKVTVKNLKTNTSNDYEYDKLLIATGASPIKPSWVNVNQKGVFCLKTLKDAKEIKSYIEHNDVKKAIIVGAGYIGLEMSESLVEQGIAVTLVQRGGHVGGGLDRDMVQHIEEYLHKKLTLRLKEEVRTIEEKENHFVLVTDKDSYETDMIIIAIGIVPNSKIAKDAGIETNDKGSIIVNSKMETNIKDIFSAGDCAVQYHRIKKKNDYIPLGTHANKQGKIAGTNMVEERPTRTLFAGVLGTSIFKIMDLNVARTGLNEKEAKQEDIDYKSVSISSLDHAGYYPGAKKMFVKLLFSPTNHKLIGGQFIGQDGVDKQVDVLATALYHEMTLDQLLELDLAYAPPFSSVWSPVQQAAQVALKREI